MKPSRKFNRIYQEKLKNFLVFYIGIFLCMYRLGSSAGGKCGRPGRTKNSNFEPVGKEFRENDKVRYVCTEANHIMLENPVRQCLRNGSWSDDIPVCSKVAVYKKVELVFQDPESHDKSNYTIDGDISTCSEATVFNRTIWSGYLTTSVNITAVRVSYVGLKEVHVDVHVQDERTSATRVCSIKSNYEESNFKSIKTLTFYCPSSTIGKNIRVSCNSQSLALCEISVLQPPDSLCLSPDMPLHGRGGMKVFSNEIRYEFTCDNGYEAFGTVVVTCKADGRWSSRSPYCGEIYCHAPDPIENGFVEYAGNKWKIPHKGKAKFSCREGFYLSGKEVITCNKWQAWDSPSPVCILNNVGNTENGNSNPKTESWRQNNVTQCGKLPQIANGVLIFNSSLVGSTAWLKCSEGFRPLTDDSISCLPNGKWSSQSLHCTIIECDTNPVVPHGKAIFLNNSSYYGSHIQIKCNEGYTSNTIITRRCDEYGSWGDLNVCIDITCGAFNKEDIENGQWLSVNGSDSLYVLICPENFYIEGSPVFIRCLTNGSWSYTSARCQKPFISFWGGNWTPDLILIAAAAVGIASAIIILCLSVVFLVIKKRRQAQTNTTVFHMENMAQKGRIRQNIPQRQKHHSTAESYNTVEMRCKSICTFPRKPRSTLPNLPVDADPVYAQPFETATTSQKTSIAAADKKDDLYNTHIYAEPIDSRRHIPTHVLVSTDKLRNGRSTVARTKMENKLPISVQTDQQNCDKKCAIYDSSGNASFNKKVVNEEHFEKDNNKSEFGNLKKKFEFVELL